MEMEREKQRQKKRKSDTYKGTKTAIQRWKESYKSINLENEIIRQLGNYKQTHKQDGQTEIKTGIMVKMLNIEKHLLADRATQTDRI